MANLADRAIVQGAILGCAYLLVSIWIGPTYEHLAEAFLVGVIWMGARWIYGGWRIER